MILPRRRCPRYIGPILILLALLVAIFPILVFGQQTGTLTIVPPSSGGGTGDVTAVGTCLSGDCFTAELANLIFASPDGSAGTATFRAITLTDLPSTLATDVELSSSISSSISAHSADSDSHHVWPLTDAEVPDALTLAESSVTAHEGALSITESQITDLAHTVDTDTTCLDAGVACLFAGSSSEGGSATTALSLVANGGNCAAGNYPLGVDASGTVEGCTAISAGIGGSTGATDNTLLRADGAGGSTLQSSLWILDDAGKATVPTSSTAGVCFGDGDTCIYESTDDSLHILSPLVGQPLIIGSVGGDMGVGFAVGGGTGLQLVGTSASATLANIRPRRGDNTGLGTANGTAATLVASGVQSLTAGATEVTLYVEQVNSPSSQTCTSNGTGAAGTLAVTVSGVSNVEVTQADADGCGATLSETGATRGAMLTVSNVSNAGATLDFADSAGIQETGTGCSLALYGVATFRYITDRWLLQSCIPSN